MADLPHLDIAARAAEELVQRDDVRAVLLTGSVARGEHRAVSDVDLLVVGPEATAVPVRAVTSGVLVERIAHSVKGWEARFDRPKTSWLYAFLDALVLHDDGAGARLQELAHSVRTTYRTAPELSSQIATMLWHGQAKLQRAASGDELVQGFWGSIMVEYLLNGLYAVHDVPLPAGSRLVAHLGQVPLSDEEFGLVRGLLAGTTAERLSAASVLTAGLLERLGPADHEV